MPIYRIGAGKAHIPISLGVISVDVPTEYPAVWFESPENTKPVVEIYNMNAANAWKHLNAALEGQSWVDILVSTFMVKVIEENIGIFTERCPARWTSFGQVIADADADVTPLDLLRITEVPAPTPVVGQDTERDSRLKLFFSLLMIPRKALTRNKGKQFGIIRHKLHTAFQTAPMLCTFDQVQHFEIWATDDYLSESFMKIICAVDMFLFRFSSNKYAKIRMATQVTRYRGCSAFTSLHDIAELARITVCDLKYFAFTERVAKELMNVTKTGQETEDVYGYFPYLQDLKLSNRSPYSVSANPTLYTWIHTIGVILGSPRSRGATMPTNPFDLPATITSAAYVADGLGNLVHYDRCSTDTCSKSSRPGEERTGSPQIPARTAGTEGAAAEDQASPAVPRNRMEAKAYEILTRLRRNRQITEEQKAAIRDRVAAGRESRKGTFGNYLASYFDIGER